MLCSFFCDWNFSQWSTEDRTNGDVLIGPTCYFCRILKHTWACVHTNTHNLRNVSRRFECQGFPSCWPAVRAAAGLGCVAVYKETQRTTCQGLLLLTNCLSLWCAQTKHLIWNVSYQRASTNTKSHKADLRFNAWINCVSNSSCFARMVLLVRLCVRSYFCLSLSLLLSAVSANWSFLALGSWRISKSVAFQCPW